METISLRDFPMEAKKVLLERLGFATDGTYVLNLSGEKVLDPYTREPVELSRMLILPGSTIVLDDNPVSVANFFEEFGEIL